MTVRPYILTIAGFDPSGGAGLLADIKTIEALKCYGVGICTANTVQNDRTFLNCYWTPIEVIIEQLTILMERFSVKVVKIGIVEDWKKLLQIVDFLQGYNDQIKIILDPVLSSSSGFDFEESPQKDNMRNTDLFEEVLNKIYLLTPNYNEIQKLYPQKSVEDAILTIQNRTNLFLKGGHRDDNIGKDQLFTKSGQAFVLNPKTSNISEKHGSGCILSSAIAAYISKGFPILKACLRAKRFTEQRLSSNPSLLAYYNI